MSAGSLLTAALGGRWYEHKARSYGIARCVRHDDHSPSLGIFDGKNGPLVTCYAGCDWRDIREELCKRGLLEEHWRQHRPVRNSGGDAVRSGTDGTARALAIWNEAKPLGQLAFKYFASRHITDLSALPDMHSVLRFHPYCPFGRGQQRPCIVALWTDVITVEPRAIHRTALKPDGTKLDRMSLGPTTGCVIRLWPDDCVSLGLVIGEGIESTLAAAMRIDHRGTLLQPAWAAGDAGHIAKFAVLAGVEALTILADNDESQRGQSAAAECEQRWIDADREVTVLTPETVGADFNDIGRAS